MLYTKEIEHNEVFDVVVVGGGCAGFTAAVAAARNGAKTALIEDQGALGGIMTTGGNPQIGIFYAYHRPVIAGIGWELCKRLEAKGYATIPDFGKVDTRKGGTASNVQINRAMTEVEMNRMCREAGVSLFFHTKVEGGVVNAGQIEYIIAAEKRGLVSFMPRFSSTAAVMAMLLPYVARSSISPRKCSRVRLVSASCATILVSWMKQSSAEHLKRKSSRANSSTAITGPSLPIRSTACSATVVTTPTMSSLTVPTPKA